MLSPHEFATLMLIKSAPDQVERDRVDLATLIERRLVLFEHSEGDRRRPVLSPSGYSMVEAAERYRPAPQALSHAP
jgi:hypothetical protein